MSTAPYTIQLLTDSPSSIAGEADDLTSALDAAWALNRHTERDVEIIDNRDGEPRRVGVLGVQWMDEEPLVLVAVPEAALRRLRDIWENGRDVDIQHEAITLLRDLFDGQDGYLQTVNDVLGPR